MPRRFVKDLLRGRELEELQEEIDDILTKKAGIDIGKAPKMLQQRLFPPMDVHDTKNELIIILDMGGFGKEHIDLKVSEDGENFQISGQRETESYEDENLIEEGRIKEFSKSIELPTKINPESVQASYEQGTLELKFKKAKETKGRKIDIE